MNKLILTSLLSILSMATACSENNEPEGSGSTSEVTITAEPSSITAECEAAEFKISVSSSADWAIRPEADWISATPTGGSKGVTTEVKVKLSSNAGFTTRTSSLIITGSGKTLEIPVTQHAMPTLNVSVANVSFGAQGSSSDFVVEANDAWTAASSADWCVISPASGEAGETTIKLTVAANASKEERTATITIKSGELTKEVSVNQYTDEITAPEGYTLVWHDEFNSPNGSMPNTDLWYYDEWAPGFVNNELQRYVAGKLGNDYTAIIEDGILNIIARKYGSQVISARINTRELWTYGYFEARLLLPKGRGTWPAFWMMPANGNNWPHCGEIDIMEEVGTHPNYTSSSIHCSAYNHTIGTQKTAERLTPGAEEEFHVYALEWTPESIRTYVDGKLLLNFANDGKGNQDTWPFNKPFHPILNLAWGGSWGGMNGVDDSALPATYKIDYVRVFQKK